MNDERSHSKSRRGKPGRSKRSIAAGRLQELLEKEMLLQAIQNGEIDAVVVESAGGRKLLRTLESDEHPYRMLVESMNEGAGTLLADGTIFYGNGFLSRLLGETSDGLIGRALQEFVEDQDKTVLRDLIEAARKEAIRGEVRLRGAHGALVPVSLSLAPVELGQVAGLSLVATDLTDRKAVEEALKALNETLEKRVKERTADLEQAIRVRDASLRTRDEFLSVASHELRTPLMTLKIQNQIARHLARRTDDGHLEEPSLANWLTTNERQIQQLTRLVDDMLDVSRIELNKLEMVPEEVDLSELVRAVVEMLRPQLTAAGCEVSVEIPEPVIGVWDRFRLEQVVTNLLTNAAKYAARSRVVVCVTRDALGATLIVQDHGMGIAQEYQERIFNRFERGVSARQVGGVGIGLYVSRHIVQAHRGRIWVESEHGKGAKFVVRLPFGAVPVPLETANP